MHKVDRLLVAAGVLGVGVLLGFALGAGAGYALRSEEQYIEGVSDGVLLTDKQWQLYKKTHCVCWLNDNRCNVESPIVVCRFPAPLKKGE